MAKFTFRNIFLENHTDKITNKNIIEFASGDGMVSENILDLSPKKFIMSDNDLEMLSFNPLLNEVTCLKIDILNIPDLSAHNIDTVVCCGYLYHTAHPLWALEQMLKCRPKWFYLETFVHDDPNYYKLFDEPSGRGMHTRYPGQIMKQLILSKSIIQESVESLQYTLIDKIDNNCKDAVFYASAPSYFMLDFWKESTGFWFERND